MSTPTPYYQDELVTLYAGDCIEVMRELPAASIDTAAALNGWATCPRCRRDLYPRTARRSDAGWVCANRAACDQIARSVALGEEIAWLRSFGWGPEQIARRLNVTVSCVEKRLARERSAA